MLFRPVRENDLDDIVRLAARAGVGMTSLPHDAGRLAARIRRSIDTFAGALPRGWSRADWSAVPAVLQNRADRSVPALCFRVAEAEGPLPVAVRRHEVAEALKLRVTQGELVTLFSPSGESLTAVDLRVDVLEKSTLRVRLPEGARLFNTFVNGGNIPVVIRR